MDKRLMKVSLYVRDRKSREQHLAKPKKTYPMDTIWVLRYGKTWQTLDGTLTYVEAAAKAAAKTIELLTGVPQKTTVARKPATPDSLDTLIDAYLNSTKKTNSHRTWLAYKLAMNSFFKSCQCAVLGDITEKVLDKFVADIKLEGLSDRTIHNRVANVICFLREHKVKDVCLVHAYVEKTVRAYRPDEVRDFFTAARKYPDLWLLFQFFLCTGAREQEVMYAEYADIDFKDSVYNVTSKAHWRPKDLAEREIPIPTHLVEALRERKKSATSKLIFPTPSNKPDGHMLRHLQMIVEEAELSGHWELHKWRKTYATLQARKNVDVKILQGRLGHSDIETTLSYLEGEDARSERSKSVWATASKCHCNLDFRFNSQSTAMQFTLRRTIGGRAWRSIQASSDQQEKALVVWANTSLGLLLRWWHSNKQQSGRGNLSKSTLQTLPVLDVPALAPPNFEAAVKIFDEMCHKQLRPIHEIDKDATRKELDERFGREVLGLPESILAPGGALEVLRMKLAQEPSIRGNK
jgi:integrase